MGQFQGQFSSIEKILWNLFEDENAGLKSDPKITKYLIKIQTSTQKYGIIHNWNCLLYCPVYIAFSIVPIAHWWQADIGWTQWQADIL